MKINIPSTSPAFTPFSLNITIETLEEARALYAIFNHAKNVELLPPGAYRALNAALDKYETTGTIANNISYTKFYQNR